MPLVLMELQHHPGRVWLEYDKAFQQQAAMDSTLAWNIIHQGIQASTIFNQGSFCTTCNQTDHVAQQCALTFFRPEPPIGGLGTVGHGRLAGPQLKPAGLSPY